MVLSRKVRRRFRWLRIPQALKRLTDPTVGRIAIRIRSGVNRGMRWSLASAGNGYGSGRRAAKQMELIAALVRPGEVVWDVGAHHGYVTLCLTSRVGKSGEVHAFEPSARNLLFLRRHVAWNGLGNVRVHGFALSSFDGRSSLGGGSTSKQHRLGGVGETVEVKRPGTVLGAGISAVPTFVKIDVEGAEADLLRDAVDALGGAARLLVAVHSAQVDDRCMEVLAGAGHTVIASEKLERSRREGWRGDADLYSVGPDCTCGADDLEILKRVGF